MHMPFWRQRHIKHEGVGLPETKLETQAEGALEVRPQMPQALLPIVHDRLHKLNEDIAQLVLPEVVKCLQCPCHL